MVEIPDSAVGLKPHAILIMFESCAVFVRHMLSCAYATDDDGERQGGGRKRRGGGGRGGDSSSFSGEDYSARGGGGGGEGDNGADWQQFLDNYFDDTKS